MISKGVWNESVTGNRLDHRRARVAYFFLLFLALISLALGLINLVHFKAIALSFVEFVVAGISLAAWVDLQKRKNLQRASWIAVGLAGGLVVFFFYYVRADFSAAAWAAFFVMLNFFLLGTRKALYTYTVFMGSILGLAFLHREQWPALHSDAALVNIVGALIAIGIAAYQQERSREQAEERLEELANKDFLTGVSNRRHFIETMARVQDEQASLDDACALLLVDVDNFKQINDVHGHAIGDEVIVAIIQRIVSAVRAEDFVGRVGGEEFAVLLRVGDRQIVEARAEAIREAVAGTPIATEVGPLSVTISVGVATGTPQSLKVREMFAMADKRLYHAKARGRNCVVMG